MNIKKLTVKSKGYPEILRHIDSPPQQLFVAGADLGELLRRPRVAIVGTRRMTPYGEQITRRFATELAEQGVIIISGLAMGVDAASHRAALRAGGLCIVVLPCPLDKIVPTINQQLAAQVIDNGGALVSEYPEGTQPFKQNFVARNRLMSGLAQGVLITEGGEKSGSMHTARFALNQGREVMAIPGNITLQTSAGTNNLIKSGKAAAVTEPNDVLNILGLRSHKTKLRQVRGRNHNEQLILDLMLQGHSDGDQLLERSGLEVSQFGQVLTMLEIAGKIRPLSYNHWSIS